MQEERSLWLSVLETTLIVLLALAALLALLWRR